MRKDSGKEGRKFDLLGIFRRDDGNLDPISLALAGVVLIFTIKMGVNLIKYDKSEEATNSGREQIYYDNNLGIMLRYPTEWGITQGDNPIRLSEVAEKSLERFPNEPKFDLLTVPLVEEVTPIVFLADEGIVGHRMFASFSIIGKDLRGENLDSMLDDEAIRLKSLIEFADNSDVTITSKEVMRLPSGDVIKITAEGMTEISQSLGNHEHDHDHDHDHEHNNVYGNSESIEIKAYYTQVSKIVGANYITMIHGATEKDEEIWGKCLGVINSITLPD